MPISEKQLIANRRNALKSTGPKTPFGKFRCSRNAYKNGRYSKFNVEATIRDLSPVERYHFIKNLLNQIESDMVGKSGHRRTGNNKFRTPFIARLRNNPLPISPPEK